MPFRFNGGLKLNGHKSATADVPIRRAAIPPMLYVPLQQHIGRRLTPRVSTGQQVAAGELLASCDGYVGAPIHAPVAATVTGVVERAVAARGAPRQQCIALATSADAAWPGSIASEAETVAAVPAAQMLAAIESCGVLGLGGAGFPTHVKVREGLHRAVDTLIINGAECEPYITCDNRLLQERAAEIAHGAHMLARLVNAHRTIVALEEDMTAAAAAIRPWCEQLGLTLEMVPAIYPVGGEKQLTRVLLGREIPRGSLPIHIGVLVQNVATAAAVYRAVAHGGKLVSRVVTIAGDVASPGNFDTLIGTPVRAVLAQAGGRFEDDLQVWCGGSMMGTPLDDLDAPVTKTTNALLVLPRAPARVPLPCIRCGACVDVCPASLQPQALLDAAVALESEALRKLHLFDCIECGCCDYVCPSTIPLAATYHRAKVHLEEARVAQLASVAVRDRHQRRQARLAQGRDVLVEELITPPAAGDELRDALAAAVARARQRKPDDGAGTI
ncbi:MAG: electron transport complex subunit RsxC [Gammaproteobacteria bacterium]|nr:electron transport complex subunit RsxC [Gammaproteobacteria bacterium]